MAKELTIQGSDDSDSPTPTFGPAKPGAGVNVLWGAIADHYDLAGSTVRQTLDNLKGALSIQSDVQAVVNGKQVPLESEDKLKSGDVLEFTRRLGEKGDEGPLVREVIVIAVTAFTLGATFGYAVGLLVPLYLGVR